MVLGVLNFVFLNFFFLFKGMVDNFLKEILDLLIDVDFINFFVVVNGFIGDIEVENWLREVEWNYYIDNLWEEIFFDLEFVLKRLR